ncbi:hypothetical protein EHS13_24280 [Paenibacillus psychroresistens]|uniref:Uncharacterized protein n=2 Tax=Paenibacillus psychroresistens TaxID=1778678 RepID=A0A6B8RQL9_9BACL|nr:hypothetical protein EHS13_24280 [Paenibacillus psychroresistens]
MFIFVLFVLGLVFLVSCDSSAISLPTETKESIVSTATPLITHASTPLPSIAATPFSEPLMTENLVELFVGQERKDGSGSIGEAPYNNDHTGLHTQPLHLAFHDYKLYLFFSFKKSSSEVLDALLKQIKVSSGVQFEINPTDTNARNEVRYKMDIGEFDQTMTMQFGNTPEIFIFKAKPIQISLADASSDTPNLFFTGLPMGLNLLASDNQTITFVFSEPIDPAFNSVLPNIGEWTDDSHYTIKLSRDSFTDSPRIIFNLKSQRGNRLKEVDSYLNIRFFKERSWFNGGTNKEIVEGPRFRFYDNFIYSPDKSSYVANTYLEGAFGDEGGGYYGLVLEHRKKPAVILETANHIAGFPPKLQVYWLDNHRLIYNSNGKIQLYNVTSKLKTELILMPDPQKGYINNFTYDPFQKKLHVMWIKFDENGELGLAQLTHSLYDIAADHVKLIAEEPYKSESIEEYKYQILSLSMQPVKNGFYWTKVNKGSISTEYIGNNGVKDQAKGRIVGVSAQGVYLLDEPAYGKEGHDEANKRKLYYWKPGTAPQQILLPDNLGYLKAFGQSLSAQSFENTNLNFRFELKTNKWFPLNKEETTTTVPYQDSMAIYQQG